MASAHRAANLFPLLEGAEFQQLVASMRDNGFDPNHPILRQKGRIIDGRNRERAAKAAGVEPVYAELDANVDPWLASWRANALRRHLPQDQKAAIYQALLEQSGELKRREAAKKKAASLANSQSHEKVTAATNDVAQRRAASSSDTRKLTEQIASEINVGKTTVENVQRLKREAPEAFERVRKGESTANSELRALRALNGTKVSREKPRTEPAPAVQDDPSDFAPEDVEWTCESCGTSFPASVEECGHCEGEDEPSSVSFVPAKAIFRLETVLDEILDGWPNSVPLDELVDWLRTKHGMLKEEAEQWQKKA